MIVSFLNPFISFLLCRQTPLNNLLSPVDLCLCPCYMFLSFPLSSIPLLASSFFTSSHSPSLFRLLYSQPLFSPLRPLSLSPSSPLSPSTNSAALLPLSPHSFSPLSSSSTFRWRQENCVTLWQLSKRRERKQTGKSGKRECELKD